MTTLAQDTPRTFELGDRNDLPVAASTKIYEGAAVGFASGYARALNAGDVFAGFARRKADNSAGAAGATTIEVQDKGKVVLAVGSAAITDIGKAVFASDDNAFTLTEASNSYIGRIVRWVSTGVVVVAYDTREATRTLLTDNSGGTAADTIAVIGASYSQTEVRNAIASLAAKVNSLIQTNK